MLWHDHFRQIGKHALLSASQYHWLNYDRDRIAQYYQSVTAAARGTELHAFAAKCIELGQKLPKSHKTLNMYVNDCIGYRMKPETVLYYSDNCFGTTDAISFRNGILRISDYKSGTTPAKMDQLMIYASLFFLEYHYKPEETQIILRIYQNDEVFESVPTAEEIHEVMNKIIEADDIISKIQENTK